jgi:hypothetical protein
MRPEIPSFILAKTACNGRVVSRFEAANEDDFSRGDPKPFITPDHVQVATYHHELCLEKVGQAKTGEMWMRRSIEAVQLKNGHVFVADTMGWDAMGTRYTFILPGESRPFTDQVYWQNKAVALLREISALTQNGAEKVILEEGAQYLHEKVRTRVKPPLITQLRPHPMPLSKLSQDTDPDGLLPDQMLPEPMVRVLWAEQGKLPTGGSWFQLVLAGGSI